MTGKFKVKESQVSMPRRLSANIICGRMKKSDWGVVVFFMFIFFDHGWYERLHADF